MSDELAQRHSKALEAELITDPVAKAEAEALNGLRQYEDSSHSVSVDLQKYESRLALGRTTRSMAQSWQLKCASPYGVKQMSGVSRQLT